MYVDSHIHLTHKLYNGVFPCINTCKDEEWILYKSRDELITKMKEGGIELCIEPGIEMESNYGILQMRETYPDFLYPAVGVHPTRTVQTKWKRRKELEKLSRDKSVIAIGELGLDYHYDRMRKHRIKQQMWFIWQILLADKRQLPLILHIRLADRDAIRILRMFKRKIHGGVCHCFNKGMDAAQVYTGEFGFMLGIGASILRTECGELEEVVKNIPLEYLLLETDGPYVKGNKPAEVPEKRWRKARNTSLIIPDIAERIAEIKGINVEEVERATAENVRRVFGIGKSFH